MPVETTLRDVARDVNLSVSAVWKALADDPVIPERTKQRVRAASRRLEYQPRRYRRVRRRSGSGAAGLQRLALVLVGSERATESITGSLASVCGELNLTVKLQVLVVHGYAPVQMAQTLAEAAAENQGLILAGHVTAEVVRCVGSLGVPYVTMGNMLTHPDLSPVQSYSVTFDFVSMGRGATRAMIDRGHRRIGFMAMATPVNLWYERWLAGYRYAHDDARLPIDERLIVVTGSRSDPGERTAAAWCDLGDPPTAYVIPDANLVTRVMSAMALRGRPIANDCVVIGSTRESAEGYGCPDLPRMTSDSSALTRTCLNLLRWQARGEAASPCTVVLPHTFDNPPLPVR